MDQAVLPGEAKRPPPRGPKRSPLRLSTAEREEISRGPAVGESCVSSGGRVGRAPSTLSRDVARNGGRPTYRACRAVRAAVRIMRRPKVARLARRPRLPSVVPDILANAGGVIVSYFEWIQIAAACAGRGQKVHTRLRETMVSEAGRVFDMAEDKGIVVRASSLHAFPGRPARAGAHSCRTQVANQYEIWRVASGLRILDSRCDVHRRALYL